MFRRERRDEVGCRLLSFNCTGRIAIRRARVTLPRTIHAHGAWTSSEGLGGLPMRAGLFYSVARTDGSAARPGGETRLHHHVEGADYAHDWNREVVQ
jgi:hypothetical protein